MAKTKINKQERIIFSDIIENEDDWKEDFKDFCEANELDPEEESLSDYIQEEISVWLDCEKQNLSQECGQILAIADLGLWDGRKSGYQLINTNCLNGIFKVCCNCDFRKFYCDPYNVKATCIHHDGTNYITFREVKEGVNVQPLLDKIYNGEEIDSSTLNHYTRSLRKKVAKVYGW